MNEEELFCKLFPDYAVNGKPLSPYFDCFESGYEQAENRIEELEKKISILLSCKNCSENKGGFICQKEYEDKCLAQKIQYIKELKEENKVLAQNLEDTEILNKTYEKRFNDLEKENAELRNNGFTVSAMTEQQLKVALEKGEQLENENAELKRERKRLNDNYHYWNIKACHIDQELYDTKQQLTKAKDLLLRFVELKNKPCAYGHSINMLLYENICAETEQFLNSEVEK